MNNKKRLIGIDVGATKILGVLFEEEKPVKKIKEKTSSDKESFLRVLDKLICDLVSCSDVCGIGVGFAGMINKEGKIVKAPNIPFLDGFNFKEYLEKEYKAPIIVENDVKCFAFAESCRGRGEGAKNVVGLTLGTGVGGGIVLNCKILRGKDGSAGEIGHMVIDNGKTLENLSSAAGIMKISGRDIFEIEKAAKAGDENALGILKEAGKNLGIGLANIINILNPEIIIIGGGLSSLGDLILRPAKETALKFIINPTALNTKIVLSKLGEMAIPLGATLLLKKNFNRIQQ